MSHTNVLLSHLGEARFMSALDLTKEYCQVPLWLKDKRKTAFAMPKGLFRFTVMPFRLHGAAATIQHLVDTILGSCEGYNLAYLDNIILYSKTWEEHMHRLRQVYHHLQEAELNQPK